MNENSPTTGNNTQPETIDSLAAIDRILLILSGKGGVGKSTVAVTIAASLAQKGYTVGILDIDMHGPSVPGMLGCEGAAVMSNSDKLLPVEVTPNLKVMSTGFLVREKQDAVIWRGPMKYGVIKQFLTDVDWGTLDFLVIDSPPGTGDEPLSIAQLTGGRSEAVIVTTPQKVSIDDVRRSISFCRAVNLKIAGIIENMSGFVCPECGTRHDLFSSDGGRKLAQETGIAYLGAIPIDPAIVASGERGTPFLAHDGGATGKVFKKIVDTITPPAEKKETTTMKIAIPIVEGVLSAHFGHCDRFSIIEVDDAGNVLEISEEAPPNHEPGVLPTWLKSLEVQHIIAGGMGSRAQSLFREFGIAVSTGAPSIEPAELARQYAAGTLESGDNACDH